MSRRDRTVSRSTRHHTRPPHGQGLGARSVITEALDGVGARPGRLVVTVLGTVTGIAALVLTIGLGQTAGGQLASHFDAISSTHAEATAAVAAGADGAEHPTAEIPRDALARLDGLAGVEAAAVLGEVDIGTDPITAVPIHDPSMPETLAPPVVAAEGDLLGAVSGRLARGRFFDAGHSARGDRVAVLGRDAAASLGVGDVASRPSIFLGGHAYAVIGILDAVDIQPNLLGSVIVPLAAARRDYPGATAARVELKIAVGSASVVAHQVPIALAPNSPDDFDVAAPAEPTQFEGAVRSDIDLVFVAIGIITLLAGGLGIASVTMLGVSQRRGEIGLRRALGATRGQIAAQFVLESVVVGLLGGVIGAALGVFVVVTISLVQGWTPVLDLGMTLGGAAAGGVVGLLAGGYPAIRAALIEPVEALRAASG
ncbi:MAG: ABC transporter permease [Herbiconiux sp.]|nr:MAG: ABC transporter permease [Herbiconiux sp.]